jgi:L-ascorbate metabolism protein UlaG (beta-lactamase superfamily)
MGIFVTVIIVCISGTFLFMNQAQFGKLPNSKQMERIKQSKNWRDGAFQNLHPTPDLTEGVTYYKAFKEFLINRNEHVKPKVNIPSTKVDLTQFPKEKDVLIWFGHSSYFLQLQGKTILVDPVFCGHASPVSFITKAFSGTDNYSVADFERIDYLIITHDHWDHLDYETILALKSKVKTFICPLGVGAHLLHWGFTSEDFIEKDWYESSQLDNETKITALPARHFSGRGFKRNQSLWNSYALEINGKKIYIGGDSGYDTHFKQIGEQFNSFDLVVLENGQYDKNWKYIHMLPEEVVQAAEDLNAKQLLTVHSSKFALANHAWQEPLERVTQLSKDKAFRLLTPIIGESVYFLDSTHNYQSKWW